MWGRFADNRQLPRPRQGRPAIFTPEERPAVFRLRGLGELSNTGSEQEPLDEYVVVEDHLLAGLGSKPMKYRSQGRIPLGPIRDRMNDRLHVGDAADAVGMGGGPIEAERGAPVMDDQHDLLARWRKGVDQPPSVSAMGFVTVGIGSRVGELFRGMTFRQR